LSRKYNNTQSESTKTKGFSGSEQIREKYSRKINFILTSNSLTSYLMEKEVPNGKKFKNKPFDFDKPAHSEFVSFKLKTCSGKGLL
jgi:hypothetical protein